MSLSIRDATWLLLGSVFYPRAWYPLKHCKSRPLFPATQIHRLCTSRVLGGGDFLWSTRGGFRVPSREWKAGCVSRRTSWETWQASIHFTIMKFAIKRRLDAFSFWGKKGAFYCIKQHLMYFDIPLFELPSLADRCSDSLDFGCSVCLWESFLEDSFALKKKKENSNISMFGWLCKAQSIRTSFV